jgi:ABC-type sugar transport system ATPase subunit
VQENLNAAVLERLSSFGFLLPRRLRRSASRMINRMQINPPAPSIRIENLSGGNQQKAIVGRTLAAEPNVIIFDEPTQGIDVAAKAQIYRHIADLAAQGCGIVLISSEFIELTELCDRILVLRDGKIADEFRGGETDEESLFAACIGSAE